VGFNVGTKKATLTLILVFTLVLFSFPQINVTKAQDNSIYIRADGSVEGTDLIQRSDDVYIFTGNISGSLVVQKSFVTIDGSGFTLQGSVAYPDRGIDLSNNRAEDSSRPIVVNVTIKDIRIVNFATGIHYAWTSNNTILGNYIADCGSGIDVTGGNQNNVLIKLNTFENNTNDITINYSSGGTKIITQNNIGNFVQVWMSDQPTIDMNYWPDYNGTDNNGDGIGDTPYIINEDNQDNFPLMDKIEIPIVPPKENLSNDDPLVALSSTIAGFIASPIGILLLVIALVSAGLIAFLVITAKRKRKVKI
jgi:hypothetical protein